MVRATSPGHRLRDSWRARCRETGTPGSGERSGETPAGNGGTAPLADSYNSSHHIGDVTLAEDASTVHAGTSPRAMAALRNLAIGVLKTLGADNITKTTRAIRDEPGRALPILGITNNPDAYGT